MRFVAASVPAGHNDDVMHNGEAIGKAKLEESPIMNF